MEYQFLSLAVGKLEIEWIKNAVGPQDHSILFNSNDKTDILYHFLDDQEMMDSRLGEGYATPMDIVRNRLDLLGYHIDRLPQLLSEYFLSFPNENPELQTVDGKTFVDILSAINVNDIDFVEHEGDADIGEFFTRRILTIPQFKPLENYLKNFKNVESYVFEQIDPYIILAAIANNPQNELLTLEWRNSEPLTGLDVYQKYLIVTEGSTDGYVLKKALEILKPGIANFFDFIDMTNNYPFGGAGNLSKFFTGLTKIGTNRKIIFLFDNDTEGRANLYKLRNITHPSNFKKLALPDMPEFANFNTIGPNGLSLQNVNGKAVAIEMFLDLTYNVQIEPLIRWSSYDRTLQTYQGALEGKTKYYDEFMDLNSSSYNNYNFTLLEKLLDKIINSIL